MKLSTSMILLAVFAAAAPPSAIHHRTTISPPPPQARSGQVRVELGVRGSNVGDSWGNTLRDKITFALRAACPDSNLQSCSEGTSKVKVLAESINIKGGIYTHGDEDLTLTITSAYWHGVREIYDILMDAVAGVAVRGPGTGMEGNCHEWQHVTYCNTYDRIAVSFGGYHMNVSLESSKGQGGFNCWKPRPDVEDWLSQL